MSSSSIFFPLRSNVEWFGKENKYPLKNRIKEALLFYDELVFEAGSYICGISEKGDIDFEVPPTGLPYIQRKSLNFVEVSGEMSLSVKNNQTGEETDLIENGKLRRFWGANFLNILEDLEIPEYDFVEMKSIRLNKNGKEILKINSKNDLDNFNIKPQASGDYFLEKKVIEGLNHSLLFSSALEMPILVDDAHQKYLIEKSKRGWQEKLDSKEFETLDSTLELVVPDFSSLGFEKIIELREDKALQDFRGKIDKISKKISEISRPEEFRKKAREIFVGDLLDEIDEMAPDKNDICLDILTGIIPGGSAIDILEDAFSSYEFSKSWLSFIMKLKKASS